MKYFARICLLAFYASTAYAQKCHLHCEELHKIIDAVASDTISANIGRCHYFSSNFENFKPLIAVFDSSNEVKLQKKYGMVSYVEESFESKKYHFAFSFLFFKVLRNLEACLTGWHMTKAEHQGAEISQSYIFTNTQNNVQLVLETNLQPPYRIRLKID